MEGKTNMNGIPQLYIQNVCIKHKRFCFAEKSSMTHFNDMFFLEKLFYGNYSNYTKQKFMFPIKFHCFWQIKYINERVDFFHSFILSTLHTPNGGYYFQNAYLAKTVYNGIFEIKILVVIEIRIYFWNMNGKRAAA